MKNTGIEYEKLTQYIFSQIINQDQAKNIDVQHNVILKGKTTSHQIDVFWKFDLGGIEYCAIIQAKNWQSKVKQSDMLAFRAILEDLPSGTKGIYVSLSGYQSGAIEVARAYGISIYELRPPKAEDWDGYIKTINLEISCATPIFRDLVIGIDKEWADTNSVALPKEGSKLSCGNCDCLYDSSMQPYWSISKLCIELADRNPDSVKHEEYEFEEDTFILFDGAYIKLRKIGGSFGYSVARMTSRIDAEDFVGCVLKDVVSGKTEMFDKQNQLKKKRTEDE